jgi:hypothetical protein
VPGSATACVVQLCPEQRSLIAANLVRGWRGLRVGGGGGGGGGGAACVPCPQ